VLQNCIQEQDLLQKLYPGTTRASKMYLGTRCASKMYLATRSASKRYSGSMCASTMYPSSTSASKMNPERTHASKMYLGCRCTSKMSSGSNKTCFKNLSGIYPYSSNSCRDGFFFAIKTLLARREYANLLTYNTNYVIILINIYINIYINNDIIQ